jgi:hypothetical protein
MNSDHVSVHLEFSQTGGARGLELALRDRFETGANLLRYPCGHIERQTDQRGQELDVVEAVPGQHPVARQQQRYGEIPDEQLQKQRHVPEHFDIGAADDP